MSFANRALLCPTDKLSFFFKAVIHTQLLLNWASEKASDLDQTFGQVYDRRIVIGVPPFDLRFPQRFPQFFSACWWNNFVLGCIEHQDLATLQ